MKSKVIGFDLDGTIIDHSANKIKLAHAYGYNLSAEQTPSGILGSYLPAPIKNSLQNQLYTDLDTTLASSIMPGAFQALTEIKQLGTPYYLLSRRQPAIAIALLEQVGLWPGLFDEHNTAFVEKMLDKAPFARQWEITHLIDDHIPTIIKHLAFIKYRYLFDPYSLFPVNPNYTKVGSWAEISQLVCGT